MDGRITRRIGRMRERILRQLKNFCQYTNDLDAHLDANILLFHHEHRKLGKLIKMRGM